VFHLPLFLTFLVLFAASGLAMDGVHFTAKIKHLPDVGLVGEWRVGERTVHVGEDTGLHDEHGPFDEGACVEVEGGLRENGTVEASTVETRPQEECGVEVEEIRIEGVVGALPGGNHVGEWEIGDHIVVVKERTELHDEHGPFVVGACVVVEGLLVEEQIIAEAIVTLPPGECGLPEPELIEFTGLIRELPGGGLLGEWIVGERSVSVGEETELSANEGPFEEGACVEVGGHEREDGSVEALAVRTEDPAECGVENDEPDEEPEDDEEDEEDEPEDDHNIRFNGLIERLPDNGFTGRWVVKGRTVLVDELTELDTEHGPFVVGACVEVEGVEVENGVHAWAIETESFEECGHSDGPGLGPARNQIEFTGRVEGLPAQGLLGEWIVNGLSVFVLRSTELRLEKGADLIGVCVEVRGSFAVQGEVRARRLGVESDEHCEPGEALPKVDFEGPVQELPEDGLEGEWTVGGIIVHVSGATEIQQDRGPLTIGACVQVEDGDLQPDNSIVAHEVEVTSSGAGCKRREPEDVEEVSFRGLIQELPPDGVIGEWRVAGRIVLVTSSTILDLAGDPQVEMCVKVSGVLLPDDVVLARKITQAEFGACGGSDEPAELRLKGILHELPDLGLLGEWLVGDYVVVVTDDTRLEDEHGPFEEGACVRVLGKLQEDQSVWARVVETEEPEDCGLHDEEPEQGPFEFLGQVETAPKTKSHKGASGSWMIGKYAVTISAATVVNQSAGNLSLGACAVVSGVPNANGAFTATSIDVQSASGVCFEAEGLVNAASFESQAVSPGEIISIFGLSVGPPEDAAAIVEEDRIQTELGGTRVLFDAVPAALVYVSSSQINAVVPYSVAGQPTTLVQVEHGGAWSNIVTLDVAEASPGVFTLTQTGAGQAAALNVEADGSLTVNGAGNPVARGGVVVLYATGEGVTDPAGTDGEIVNGEPPLPVLPVTVTIGGVPAVVLYSGAVPGFVTGLLQVNAVVSEQVVPGVAVPVVITVGDQPSQDGPTIAVR
jgi:uncharacterized protein (TIGR03437 family)